MMNNINTREPLGTYFLHCSPNKEKENKVFNLLKEYRKTAKVIANQQWKTFQQTGKFNKYLDIKHIHSLLSQRYKQTCQWQVVATLESFISNVQNKFKSYVYHSNLSEDDKIVLLHLNKHRAWYRYEKTFLKIKNKKKEIVKIVPITEEHIKLAKTIFRYILRKWNKPNFTQISMHLDQKVAILLPKEENKAKEFDYWIKLSTLEKGNPIYIPLKKNTYAETLPGKWLNFIQISIKERGLKIGLIKQLDKKDYKPEIDCLSLDLGLAPLFASDRGDLIGRQFFDFLKKQDKEITKRMSYLQSIGIRPSKDKKYVKYVSKLSAFLKNEINRFLNRLIDIYRPSMLVVEKLDFRSPELSRRMNRLIQSFGKRYVNEKLSRFKELYGIEVIYLNPAYTSLQCSNCGYIDSKNRKNTQEFECRACGKRINAQVNGAKVLYKRSSLVEIKPCTPKKKVLRILVKQYLERHSGCNSAPLELLRKNPYFRDFLSEFLQPLVLQE